MPPGNYHISLAMLLSFSISTQQPNPRKKVLILTWMLRGLESLPSSRRLLDKPFSFLSLVLLTQNS
jgi:hypothetical protein